MELTQQRRAEIAESVDRMPISQLKGIADRAIRYLAGETDRATLEAECRESLPPRVSLGENGEAVFTCPDCGGECRRGEWVWRDWQSASLDPETATITHHTSGDECCWECNVAGSYCCDSCGGEYPVPTNYEEDWA